MTATAIFCGLIGMALIFLPQEIIQNLGLEPSSLLQLILQAAGGLYYAFAMLNWMSRGTRIGGIFNRPVAVANFSHFLIVALALIRGTFKDEHIIPLVPLAIVYAVFAVLFGWMLFRHSPAS